MDYRVILIENNRVMLERLSSVVRGIDGYEIDARYQQAGDALGQGKMFQPNLILLDIDVSHNLALIPEFTEAFPGAAILCLSSNWDANNAAQIVKAGAKGYLIKPFTAQEFIEAVHTFGKSGMAVDENEYFANRPKSGILVGNGKDKYEEVGDASFKMCRLTKGDENFLFTKYEKNGKTEYYGTKKGKVEANSRNFLAELVEGQSYGDADMSRLLNAMLPDSEKSADMPRYAYVKGGRLANGLHYEDYQSRTQHEMSVIRYYFDNHVLVKIAAASYYRDANGKPNGHKCIIRLTEFSARPDMTLLALPEGLRDVTKRKEAKE